MTQYGRLERGIVKTYTALAGTTMALPPQREHYPQFAARVVDVHDLSPAFRRIVIEADELREYRPLGPDEYVGLFMPPPGRELVMPENVWNPRSALPKIPEATRPDLRWYTIRAHDPAAGRIDVDIVNSGHDGPGARWTASAAVGDAVGIRAQSAPYAAAPPGGHHLLLGDETALPGLLAVLDARPSAHSADGTRLTVLAEVPDDDHVYDEVRAADITLVHRGSGAPGSALVPALDGLGLRPGSVDFAWICAEGGTVAAAKRFVTKDLGVGRRAVVATGFWRVGRARP